MAVAVPVHHSEDSEPMLAGNRTFSHDTELALAQLVQQGNLVAINFNVLECALDGFCALWRLGWHTAAIRASW